MSPLEWLASLSFVFFSFSPVEKIFSSGLHSTGARSSSYCKFLGLYNVHADWRVKKRGKYCKISCLCYWEKKNIFISDTILKCLSNPDHWRIWKKIWFEFTCKLSFHSLFILSFTEFKHIGIKFNSLKSNTNSFYNNSWFISGMKQNLFSILIYFFFIYI